MSLTAAQCSINAATRPANLLDKVFRYQVNDFSPPLNICEINKMATKANGRKSW